MLAANISGSRILRVDVFYDKIISTGQEAFVNAVSGQTIHAINRVGKYLVFVLDDVAFISHLRMEGKYNLIAAEVDVPLTKHEHLVFHLADGRELRYHDTRKFGRMMLTGKDDYRDRKPLSTLAPEPSEATAEYLWLRVSNSRRPLKSLLLDQTVLAGIGNIYANEICLRARVDPRQIGNMLTEEICARLLTAATTVLAEAVAAGGTTISSFNSGGIDGLFQAQLLIYGQKTCQVCGGEVTRLTIGGRGTYFCHHCQAGEEEDEQKCQ
jgi:formamidopyrimidine-DNA glycosylase